MAFREGGRDRNDLAKLIRVTCLELLKKLLKNSPLAEDFAQEVTLKVLGAFEKGVVSPEDLTKYTHAACRNRWRSHGRLKKERIQLQDFPEDDTFVDDEAHGERLHAEHDERHQRLERVRALLPEMPDNYRVVILAHYLQGCSIEELVEEELTSRLRGRGQDPDDPLLRSAERSKVRATVDQRLSRARAWLARQLDRRGGGP